MREEGLIFEILNSAELGGVILNYHRLKMNPVEYVLIGALQGQ